MPVPRESEVRITLTDVFNKQEAQNVEVTKILSEIKTGLAVLTKAVEPQTGVNSELFRRILTLEKKVYALPSAAVVLSLISLALVFFRK